MEPNDPINVTRAYAGRRARLRLILFDTCPPRRVGPLWLMPAWVWRDVRSVFLFFTATPIQSPTMPSTLSKD